MKSNQENPYPFARALILVIGIATAAGLLAVVVLLWSVVAWLW